MSELPLSDQAIVRLADRVAAWHPDDVALLERLVRTRMRMFVPPSTTRASR